MSFKSGAGTPGACNFLSDTEVTGSRWHTVNGLHVGAPLAATRRLFPQAENVGKIPGKPRGIPTGSTLWWLTKHTSGTHAAEPLLAAYVRGGRVAALGNIIVGH